MKILLVCSESNKEILNATTRRLINCGHEVLLWDTSKNYGSQDNYDISDQKRNIDVVIIIATENIENVVNANTELAFLIGSINYDRIIVIKYSSKGVPTYISNFIYIKGDINSLEDTISKLSLSIDSISQQLKNIKINSIEHISEMYIKDSLSELSKIERSYKIKSYMLYTVGFLLLVVGFVAIYLLQEKIALSINDLPHVVFRVSYMFMVIGFIIALSRYTFILGKSFMVEAIRNYDRIHAIKFGEFYLRTHSDKIEWSQVKEAFYNWNLDSGSNFKDQNENVIDSKVINEIIELLKVFKKNA